MNKFNNIFLYCKNEYNCNGHNLETSFKENWEKIFNLYRKDPKAFYLKYKHINIDGIDKYQLTNEEAFLIVTYTAFFSSWINTDIRNAVTLSKCKKLYSEYLDKSLDKIPCYNDKYVFREEFKNDNRVLKEKKEGQIINIPFFISTYKENWDDKLSDEKYVVWLIKTLDLNSKARDISQISNFGDEEEVLFKKNASFKIEKINFERNLFELVEV